ncbi:MAG: hypothetical protein V5A64_05170 [Candidatus Thermoplasmatota archaeon]
MILAVIAILIGIFSIDKEFALGVISLILGILGLFIPIFVLGMLGGMA